MSSPPPVSERKLDEALFPEGVADIVLEIGYLAMVSDGPVSAAEAEAFGRVARKLRGEIDVEGLLDSFSDAAVRVGLEARLSERAGRLADARARRYAYRVASALAMSDLASNEREGAFDALLIQALGLSEAEADALALDAYARISVV